MRNIRLTLAYDGTDFNGWQRQLATPTIQQCIEDAIWRITGSKSTVWGSGRTDAGVHAAAQVANFKTASPIPCRNLPKALNDVLPPSVRVNEAREVALNFHARYHAKSKTYRYRILQERVSSPFLARFVYHYTFPLDHVTMDRAARLLEGTHDFTSFAAAEAEKSEAGSQRPERQKPESHIGDRDSPAEGRMVRTIFRSRITRRGRLSMLVYEVCGSGFLHHMVRNIVGTLLEVGRGKIPPEEITRILNSGDRSLAGPTAPAQGLCLMKVEY